MSEHQLVSKSRRNLIVLFGSILVALGSGTNYVYSAYAPQLGAKLHLTHTQVNIVGIAGNLGVYCSGPFWGKFIDARGPRIPLLVAFILLSFGYGGIRAFYTGAIALPESSAAQFNRSVAALFVLSFCTGSAGNAGITSAMNSAAKSFPDRMRASVTGMVASGFGLSAFFFSTTAHVLFPGDTGALLLTLALGSSFAMLIGFFIVHPVPHTSQHDLYQALPASESQLSVADQLDTFSPVEATYEQDAIAHVRGTSRARDEARRSRSLVREDMPFLSEGASSYRGRSRNATRLALDIPAWSQSGSQDQDRRRSVSMHRDFIDATSNLREPSNDDANIHGLALFKTVDFWVVFGVLSLLAGTGLMYINNVGLIVQVLLAAGNPNWDRTDGGERQAAQVSIISIANAAGRLLIGLGADHGKNKYDAPRSYFLVITAIVAIASQVTLMYAEVPDHLWMSSGLLGLAYGATFGLCPVLTIEWFGISHFSGNWGFVSLAPVLSGNLFNLMFGRNLDNRATEPQPATTPSAGMLVRGLPSSKELLCYDGNACYTDSIRVSLFACFCALAISMFAAWRDKRRQKLEHSKAGLLWTVEEESSSDSQPMAQYPSPLTEPENELPSSQASSTLEGYPRVYKDPVHDYVELPAGLSCIVDTPQFQRLRELKQLGSAYYVFPGAAHNRFEHCLGVAHLARKMIEGLRTRQPELGIDDRDVKCVTIAGLCHDLGKEQMCQLVFSTDLIIGHGPFSHVWDNKFIHAVSPGTNWTHEMGSEMMFDAICNDYDVDLTTDEQNFIKDLIRGRPSLSSGRVPPEKPFLFEIVANNRNGIDVDKFDYIQRDTHAVGNKMNDVTSRLIRSARVIDNEICYADKDWYMVSQLFESRFALHKMIYNHKSCKSIELMIVDALVLADPFMHLADKIHNAEEYLHLNDSVLLEIERSQTPRIRTRQLYKQVDVYMFAVEHRSTLKSLTPERTAEVAKTIVMPEGEDAELAAEDVAIDMTLLHLGMKDKRPVDLVKFYGKPSSRAAPENASHVFSQSSQELCLRIFTRNPEKFGIVQTACREVLKQLFPPESDQMAETPSTPKTSSMKILEGVSGTISRSSPQKTSHARSVSTPFAHNPFTTVPPNYRESGSPQLQGTLTGKRYRGSQQNTPDIPDPKRIRPLPLTNQSSPTRGR
ncbi:MFS general substrate transporter [Rhizoctonia solani]|uniref:MFS general substrate transporter n=1 Tax=Rhizoctonia solani TaxID=456999 RepID=A0A8H7H9S6_9AGAM|nr:MFS general substrate transporter [Rhizoctonia solani]KAF8759614.1 MFS general substrate transporter [Rhizoctonia solani]